LWAAIDDLKRATRWASWLGQGIAWLMIVAGVSMIFGLNVPLLGSGPVNGLWMAFIGWFLSNSASQGYRQVVIQDVLEDVPVSRMMRTDPPTVTPGISISSLVHDHVMRTDDHAFPVMEGDRLVGLVCLHDVRSVSRADWETVTVRQIMTPRDDLVTMAAGEQAADALTQLQQLDVRQLPIVDNGSLVGLLRRRDLIKWLQLQSDLSLS
jgi:CBS domain-containing protein